MLDLMLGNDPSGFSLGEVCNWFMPYRSHHFDIKCACGKYPCRVWEDLKILDKKTFHMEALKYLDASFLVDSSKYLPWIIDVNETARRTRQFASLNVLIYKEPVSLFRSYQKRDKPGMETLVAAYSTYERFLDTNLPFVSINYEELVQDPETMLRLLCDVLGIPFFSGKHAFWLKTHHHLFGSAGVRRQLHSKDEQYICADQSSSRAGAIDEDTLNRIRGNSRIAGIHRQLSEMDVKDLTVYPQQQASRRARKGLFYYKSKVRRHLKRLRPEPHADKEAEFVQADER